jgi:hypothetical protein
MHEKYAKDGLVAISVSVDDREDKDVKDRIMKFLEKQKATQTNYWLQDDPSEVLKKLNISAVPCIYVFNRDNQWVEKFADDNKVDHDKIEKLVVELLKQKPGESGGK